MIRLAIALAVTLTACDTFQTENSFSGDAQVYQYVEGSEGFQEARQIILSSCVGCHADFGSYTEAKFIQEGYVVAGSATLSYIFSKLRGANVGGPEDMPPDATLSTDEIETIREWIDNI